MLPVEELYLRAADLIENSPEKADALLQSLIDPYGPKSADQSESDVAAVVQLAEQRLSALRAELTKRHERALAALNERLAVAERLSQTEPGQAAAMYRAIIALHQDNAWAKEAVTKAQARLENLNQQTQ
jgi:hypothetical protein